MGTVVSMRVYGKEEAFSGSLWDMVAQLENTLLSKSVEGSEVFVLNRAIEAGEQKLQVSDKLYDYLQHGSRIFQDSQGAFDLSIGALSALWNLDAQTGTENPVIPTEEAIREAKEYIGFQHCQLQDNTVTVDARVQFDLGAVGKGLALDEIRASLEQEQVTAAVISMGGSIMTYGEKPDGSSFKVAIVNPFHTDERIGYLELKGTNCISTSGSYERYIEVDNNRYHHILDPFSGYPAKSGVVSVTVVSDNGFESDALSTACFVLGVEKGMILADKYHAQVLFVTDSGEIVMSPALEALFVKE